MCLSQSASQPKQESVLEQLVVEAEKQALLPLALGSYRNGKESEVYLAKRVPTWSWLTDCPSVELIGNSLLKPQADHR